MFHPPKGDTGYKTPEALERVREKMGLSEEKPKMEKVILTIKRIEGEEILISNEKWRIHGVGKDFKSAFKDFGISLDAWVKIYSEPGLPIAEGSIEYVKEFLDTFLYGKEEED